MASRGLTSLVWRRWWPATGSTCPAYRSTGSALPGWRPSTSRPRRSWQGRSTASAPGAGNRCRGGPPSPVAGAGAVASGRFVRALVPVRDVIGEVVLARDEFPRPDVTPESLAALKPAFDAVGEQGGFDAVALQRYPHLEAVRHLHTAGTSSGVVDGASAVLVGSAEFGRRSGLRPRARVRAYAAVGSEPTLMLDGPAAATEKALRRAGMAIGDIDLFEVNEAFAAVVLRYMRATGAPHERVNVNGGSIALGHPLGATGAMLVGTVLDELERRDLCTGLVTLCAAAGQATATIIERV